MLITIWVVGKTPLIEQGIVVRRSGVLVKRERLRQRPESSPIPFLYWPVVPKIVRGDGFDANFDGAANDVLVRIRVLADKKSRDADFRTTWTIVKIIEAGHHVRGGCANLPNGQNAPWRVAERYKIPSRRCHFAGNCCRLGE